MSFKSEAHREKLRQLVKDGKVTQKQFDEKDRETPHGIPDRLPKKEVPPWKRKK